MACKVIQQTFPLLLLKYCEQECVYTLNCQIQIYSDVCLPWGDQSLCQSVEFDGKNHKYKFVLLYTHMFMSARTSILYTYIYAYVSYS